MCDRLKLVVGEVGTGRDIADRCEGPDGEMNSRYHRGAEFDVVEPVQGPAVTPGRTIVGHHIPRSVTDQCCASAQCSRHCLDRGLLGDPGHNDHGQHHRRHDDDGRLQPRTKGYRRGRILIWLVAYVFAFRCQGLTLLCRPH